MPDSAQYTRLSDENQGLFARWKYGLTRLEKQLIILATLFGIVIFGLSIALVRCNAKVHPTPTPNITTTEAPTTTTTTNTTTITTPKTTTTEEPTTTKPTTTTKEPTTTTKEPTTTTKEPTTTTKEPTTTTKNPTTTTKVPTTTTKEPTTTTKKPTTTKPVPSSTKEPITSTTKAPPALSITAETTENIEDFMIHMETTTTSEGATEGNTIIPEITTTISPQTLGTKTTVTPQNKMNLTTTVSPVNNITVTTLKNTATRKPVIKNTTPLATKRTTSTTTTETSINKNE